jgi:hypothetical protein
MNWIEILLSVYLLVAIVLVARLSTICNNQRKHILTTKGVTSSYSHFIPRIVADSLRWPLTIFLYGFLAFIKELEN